MGSLLASPFDTLRVTKGNGRPPPLVMLSLSKHGHAVSMGLPRAITLRKGQGDNGDNGDNRSGKPPARVMLSLSKHGLTSGLTLRQAQGYMGSG